MKIRTQLNCFIVGIILVPLLCAILVPLYHYYSSPQRFLLKGYQEIRQLGTINMSENDWDDLKDQLQRVPPNVQTVVYMNKTVVISTFPELPAGTFIEPGEFFDFIRNTSGTYDYQFQSPRYQRHFDQEEPSAQNQNDDGDLNSTNQINSVKKQKRDYPFMVLSRSKVSDERVQKSHIIERFYIPAFIIFFVFELFCIMVIIHLSRTITSSITILEKNTQRIADGELDIELEKPKTGKNSNEITSLTENLEKMRCSLKEDEERRTRFIMGLSHDLRTPVALIKGYTEAISDGVVNNPDNIRKSLTIIHAKADQLESMINDLINYVKLNNADWRQKLIPETIEPLLTEFAKTCAMTGDVYKRTINTSITVSPTIKIPMDKTLFDRALENLFSNAVRYTKDGDTISISATESPENVIISVEDTGCGIAEKDIDHIFDLFYRGTTSRREQGMGIGLSVVKNIIDTHGWKIDVKSQVGVETAFIITIPLNKAPEQVV
jgi:signal transduction histidine kinase